MKIPGNTTGYFAPRADFLEKDPKSPAFIKNNPSEDIEQAKEDIKKLDEDLKKKAATQHNHDGAYASASHSHDGAYAPKDHEHDGVYSPSNHNHDGTYLKTSGGKMTGSVTLKGIHLTEGVDYGDTFPANAEVGRVFWTPVVSANG